MKRIVGFLKNRWVVSLIGLLALSILIWFIGPLIAVAGKVPLAGEVARLITILVLVVLWGLNNLRIWQFNKNITQSTAGGIIFILNRLYILLCYECMYSSIESRLRLNRILWYGYNRSLCG